MDEKGQLERARVAWDEAQLAMNEAVDTVNKLRRELRKAEFALHDARLEELSCRERYSAQLNPPAEGGFTE